MGGTLFNRRGWGTFLKRVLLAFGGPGAGSLRGVEPPARMRRRSASSVVPVFDVVIVMIAAWLAASYGDTAHAEHRVESSRSVLGRLPVLWSPTSLSRRGLARVSTGGAPAGCLALPERPSMSRSAPSGAGVRGSGLLNEPVEGRDNRLVGLGPGEIAQRERLEGLVDDLSRRASLPLANAANEL